VSVHRKSRCQFLTRVENSGGGLTDFSWLGFLEKGVVAAVGPTATVLLAGFLGQRFSAMWSYRQKRRELEMALANSFYTSYGDFISVWKQWNWCKKTITNKSDLLEKQIELHAMASSVEGNIESVLLKISSERILSDEDLDRLGVLRQSFQFLRENIQKGESVSYGYASDPGYIKFKELSTFVGNLLAAKSTDLPSHAEAFKAFVEITDNRHEGWHLWLDRSVRL